VVIMSNRYQFLISDSHTLGVVLVYYTPKLFPLFWGEIWFGSSMTRGGRRRRWRV
jgi:hypothetical protein